MESIKKYNNGKIYKIVDNTNNNIYIGSTSDKTLARRLSNHRKSYKNYLKGISNYMTSFEILKNNNYSIILLENYSCNNKDELLSKERHYIDTLKCVNKCRPITTKEEKKEQCKKYYKNNKEGIIEKVKEYYQNNKEILKEYKKKYYEDNKDKVIEYHKKYREDNKDKIKEKKNFKFNCECGGHYTNSRKADHFRTIKHLKYCETIKENTETE